MANLAVRSLNYSSSGFDFGLLALEHPPLGILMKAGYAMVTLVEILFPLALLVTWFRRFWMAVIIPFHVTVLLAMNILFWENIC